MDVRFIPNARPAWIQIYYIDKDTDTLHRDKDTFRTTVGQRWLPHLSLVHRMLK